MTSESTLRLARMIALGLVLAVLGLLVVALLVPLDAGLAVLVLPAGLLGVVSPVIAYRVYHLLRERVPHAAERLHRLRAFLLATIFALAVSEGIALFGTVAFWLSGDLLAATGVVTHLLVAGLVWPSEERLARFFDGASHLYGDEPR